MNGKESSPPRASFWQGHFKFSDAGHIIAIFDAPGKLFYDPKSRCLRLYDQDGQLRSAFPMHRVLPPKSDRFPKGNEYNIQLALQAKNGTPVDSELQFRSRDKAARLNLHKFILEERGIEHPGARRPRYSPGNPVPAEQTPEARLPVAESPRAPTPTEVEDLVEQLRQKNADLETEKAARKQAEEEISRLKQMNAKKDMAIVDLTMELLELKRSK